MPPTNLPPVLAYQNTSTVNAVIRPARGLTIDTTYLMTRLLDKESGLNIFNNHIIRSKWNYQFTKEFSMRVIPQYTVTIANPALTSLQTTKQFNGDVLFTYLIHPGTAIYAGYNSDLQNIDPLLGPIAGTPLRTRTSFLPKRRAANLRKDLIPGPLLSAQAHPVSWAEC